MTDARRLRVMMLTASLGYGGAESDFVRLAKFLSRSMDVTIALFARDYGNADYSAAQSKTDMPTVLLDDPASAVGGAWRKARKWLQMRQKLQDLKLMHDVTISFLSGPNLLNALTGDPSCIIVSERGSKLHHVGIPRARKWFCLTILDPLTYRRAAKIVAASHGYAQEIAEIAGHRLNHKIVPIEGSIIADALLAQTEEQVDDDIARFCISPVAVYCSRLDRGKGIDLILPTFAQVRRKIPSARLLVIGDGPLRNELDHLCTATALTVTTEGAPTADVFLAGYRLDPMRHFRLCRAFLFPSLHEGLPNALIEAVASGIPVLAADCPWGPRSILSGPNDVSLPGKISAPVKLAHGTLMPMPNTPQGLAVWEDELCKVFRSPAGRRPLAERRAAIARFDIEETGLRWLSLIEEIMVEQTKHVAIRDGAYGNRRVSASS